MNKTSNFFCLEYVILFIQNKHKLKILVHQNGENAKSKWSLFRWNDATWKLMFHLYFQKPNIIFQFFFRYYVLIYTKLILFGITNKFWKK